MIARASFTLLVVLGVFGTVSWLPGGHEAEPVVAQPDVDASFVSEVADLAMRGPFVSDSARDELAAGRYWHAARLLREEGAAEGTPADVLTLAGAEAGWENWAAVSPLLEGQAWLRNEGEGLGVYLLGRSWEAAERWSDASVQYAEYGDLIGPETSRGEVALARFVRAAWNGGQEAAALDGLTALGPSPAARSWVSAELALSAAEAGEVGSVRRLLEHTIEPRAVSALWRAEADAVLNAGDSVGAAASFAAIVDVSDGSRRAVAMVELGRLRLAAGDTTEARALLLEALADAPGTSRSRAAEGLHDMGDHDLDRTVELARILDRAGDGARALRGYDRAATLASAAGEVLPEASRLERARLMATVASRQEEALAEFRDLRETTESERIGARSLDVWAKMRRRQGLFAQVNTLNRWLLDEYPTSSEAAEVAWSRGSNAEAAGRLDEALGHYRYLAEGPRTHARAGEARMRTGQILLRRSDDVGAVRVFEEYVEDFPDGRRWQEASYWAGRTRFQLGDSTAGRAHLERVLQQPIEYYAVMAADLLGIAFEVDIPEGSASVEPGWLTEGLVRLDMMSEAGLERGAQDEIDRLSERAERDRPVRIRLAEALIERGRTIDGINLGWAILAEDQTWDQRLLRVTYPFPYEELVRREAAEWGMDAYMMAAIIRQESAFKADIVSHAGAIGLMQVMPPTGAQLARAHGPNGFTDLSLTRPEVNLHLGAAFFVDMSARYDDELPLVLSAYNAGPTRATRWRRYPEASDPLRFTERIPFVETRGYVKSVRRNLGLYRVLYGQD